MIYIHIYLLNKYLLCTNGEGNGTPLQYSCLENPMDGGAWLAADHGVAKSWTRLSDLTFTFHALEEMATHSGVLAWRIPGKGEPGGLLSMGSPKVGHDWSDLAAAAAAVLFSWCCYLNFPFLGFALQRRAVGVVENMELAFRTPRFGFLYLTWEIWPWTMHASSSFLHFVV